MQPYLIRWQLRNQQCDFWFHDRLWHSPFPKRLCAGNVLWGAPPEGPKIFSEKNRIFLFPFFSFYFLCNFPWVTGTMLHCDSKAYSYLFYTLQIQITWF